YPCYGTVEPVSFTLIHDLWTTLRRPSALWTALSHPVAAFAPRCGVRTPCKGCERAEVGRTRRSAANAQKCGERAEVVRTRGSGTNARKWCGCEVSGGQARPTGWERKKGGSVWTRPSLLLPDQR